MKKHLALVSLASLLAAVACNKHDLSVRGGGGDRTGRVVHDVRTSRHGRARPGNHENEPAKAFGLHSFRHLLLATRVRRVGAVLRVVSDDEGQFNDGGMTADNEPSSRTWAPPGR
jgi:hypothetical protein